MNYQQSATNWIGRLANGDERAVEILFTKYFDRLIRLAARKMVGLNQAPRSSEDVALSAVRSFCSGLKGKKLSVTSEDDLWARLFTITTRKACSERRRAYAIKRGKNAQAQITKRDEDDEDFFEQVVGREPSPELAVEMADSADALLAMYDERKTQRRIIELKLLGFSTREIANETRLVERTVLWHLERIQETWTFLNNCDYLFENAFDGESFDELSESVELSLEKIRKLLELAFEFWRDETDDDANAELLRLKIFEPNEYSRRRLDDREAVERLENALGRICDHWKTRLRVDWKTKLRKAIK